MALTLTSSIDAEARELHVSGTVDADIGPGYRFRLGTSDELLMLRNFADGPIPLAAGNPLRIGKDPNTWIVQRGADGSTPEPHTATTSIKGARDAWTSGTSEAEPVPFPPGGGGGAVDSVNGQTGVVVLEAGDIAVSPSVAGGDDVQEVLTTLAASSSPFLEASGSLSASDILTLNSDPPVLVAGVSDNVIVPLLTTVLFHPGTTPYTFASQRIIIGGPAGSGFTGIDAGAAFLQEPTFDLLAGVVPSVVFGDFQYPVDLGGAPLILFAESSDPTDGDGTIDWTVTYRLIAV